MCWLRTPEDAWVMSETTPAFEAGQAMSAALGSVLKTTGGGVMNAIAADFSVTGLTGLDRVLSGVR